MEEQNLNILKTKLQEIKEMGWIKSQRLGNAGGVGNTLEDLLGIPENNLQLPDFGKWELKSQRAKTKSRLTLFHCEPQPRQDGIIAQILLPQFGWPHRKAGILYPEDEKSFRQTISAISYSDRGFIVKVDRDNGRIYASFDYEQIRERHSKWRNNLPVKTLNPVPYWTFDDIVQKLDTKLHNLIYVKAETQLISGKEYFHYTEIEAYTNPTLENFLNLVENGSIYIDFDARTSHNHGTKFRIKPSARNELYQQHIII